MKRLLFVVVVIVLAALVVAGTVSAAPLVQYSGDLCVGGTASASTSYPGAPASAAFDDDLGTLWGNNNALPAWIRYDFGVGQQHAVTRYRVYYTDTIPSWASYTYSPDVWYFQASIDGVDWITLDNQTGQGWSTPEWKEYVVTNSIPYRYYRLYITAAKGSSQNFVAVPEIEMMSGSPEPTATPVATWEGGDIIVQVDYPTPVPQYFDPTANAGDGPEPWLLRFYVGVFVVFAFTYVVFRFVDTHQFYLLFMALCLAAAWVTKSVNGAAYIYLFMLIMILVLKLWGGLQRLVGVGK
jgi:hypothetical protein